MSDEVPKFHLEIVFVSLNELLCQGTSDAMQTAHYKLTITIVIIIIYSPTACFARRSSTRPQIAVRPILKPDRTVMDKLVDYILGDGPHNRFALICSECKSHNGMALQEEFEFIGRQLKPICHLILFLVVFFLTTITFIVILDGLSVDRGSFLFCQASSAYTARHSTPVGSRSPLPQSSKPTRPRFVRVGKSRLNQSKARANQRSMVIVGYWGYKCNNDDDDGGDIFKHGDDDVAVFLAIGMTQLSCRRPIV